MLLDELQQIIRLGEGFTCEFKQSGTAHLGRELCAFANATGGVILIGVSDDGRVVGVRNTNRLKSEVQNVARSIEPPLVIGTDVVDDILIVNVPAQNSKPYSSAGKFYLRDGASSQQMSRSEIREFFFKEGVIHFESNTLNGKNARNSQKKLCAKRWSMPWRIVIIAQLPMCRYISSKIGWKLSAPVGCQPE